MEEPNQKVEGKRVPPSNGKDESTVKRAKGTNPKELGMTVLFGQKMKEENVPPSNEKESTAKQVAKINIDRPMSTALDEHLEHIVSFVDHNERDVFVLVSRRMHSIVESFSKKAVKEFLAKLKESHYVDGKWSSRVKKYAKATGARTHRRMLQCAPQVSLYSINAQEDDEYYIEGNHLALSEMNTILCNALDSIEVLDLETRQRTGTFCRVREREDGDFPTQYLCGTHVIVCCAATARIFTLNGDLMHIVDLGIDHEDWQDSIVPFGDFFYFLSEGDEEGQYIISKVNVWSGGTTRHLQPSFSCRHPPKLLVAGKWLLCVFHLEDIHVLNPKNLTVVSHFNTEHYKITCSADSGFIAIWQQGRNVDILCINDSGELHHRHSLAVRPEGNLTQEMIHGSTLYITYYRLYPSSARNQRVTIDVIDLASGTYLGEFSFPLGEGNPTEIFTNGKEVFVALDDEDMWCATKAFPMLSGE